MNQAKKAKYDARALVATDFLELSMIAGGYERHGYYTEAAQMRAKAATAWEQGKVA